MQVTYKAQIKLVGLYIILQFYVVSKKVTNKNECVKETKKALKYMNQPYFARKNGRHTKTQML